MHEVTTQLRLEIQGEVNLFLDALRESGAVNMWGASPYVEEAFDVSRREAKALTSEWMRTFSDRQGSYVPDDEEFTQ